MCSCRLTARPPRETWRTRRRDPARGRRKRRARLGDLDPLDLESEALAAVNPIDQVAYADRPETREVAHVMRKQDADPLRARPDRAGVVADRVAEDRVAEALHYRGLEREGRNREDGRQGRLVIARVKHCGLADRLGRRGYGALSRCTGYALSSTGLAEKGPAACLRVVRPHQRVADPGCARGEKSAPDRQQD